MTYANPYYDVTLFQFPTRATCPDCEGTGGWDSQPRHKDPLEHPDAYWSECNTCEGNSDLFSPKTKAISRRRVTLRPAARQAA